MSKIYVVALDNKYSRRYKAQSLRFKTDKILFVERGLKNCLNTAGLWSNNLNKVSGVLSHNLVEKLIEYATLLILPEF